LSFREIWLSRLSAKLGFSTNMAEAIRKDLLGAQESLEPSGVRLLAIRLANGIGKSFGINPFPRAFANSATAEPGDHRMVFDRIYTTNFWASAESRSGLGSEQAFAARYRERLRRCLADLGARRLFDAPCGDLNWMAPLATDPTFDYLGGDISGALIADLKRLWPDVTVRQFDICATPFPRADVWHCRDCLFHLPFAAIQEALENFARSAIPYALLTTHRALVHRNLDVPAGGFRYLDLERAPFSLPVAERYLKDYRFGRDFPRFVGLWRRETIAAHIKQWRY